MDHPEVIKNAIHEAKRGNRDKARDILRDFIKTNPSNEMGWYVFAKLAETQEQKIFCLEKVVDLDPNFRDAAYQLELVTGSIQDEFSVLESLPKKKKTEARNSKVLGAVIGIIVLSVLVIAAYFVITRSDFFSGVRGVSNLVSNTNTKCKESYLDRFYSFAPTGWDEDPSNPFHKLLSDIYQGRRGCGGGGLECKDVRWVIYDVGDGCEIAFDLEVNGRDERVPMVYINPETEYIYVSDSPFNLGVTDRLFEGQPFP